jgi:membrane protein DedA with SNARE-associated domain
LIVETLLQYFIQYHYLVIFFGTFIEGEVVLIAGGFLVSEGHLNFPVLVLLATVAAIIGDNFFFWLGRSQRIGSRHPWADRLLNFIGEHRLFKGEEFVRRHGGKSVFLVRFFYGLRFAGAMTAGYLGMGIVRFFLFNLVGSLIWAVLLGWVGYIFGESIGPIAHGVKLGEIGFILVLAGLIIIYLLNRRRKRRPQNLS